MRRYLKEAVDMFLDTGAISISIAVGCILTAFTIYKCIGRKER